MNCQTPNWILLTFLIFGKNKNFVVSPIGAKIKKDKNF